MFCRVLFEVRAKEYYGLGLKNVAGDADCGMGAEISKSWLAGRQVVAMLGDALPARGRLPFSQDSNVG